MRTSSTRAYRENRARFPTEELQRLEGKWVAFSADGCRVVASAVTIVELASALRNVGQDLADVVMERIEAESDEISLGGAELM
jgi:hypothetical protein